MSDKPKSLVAKLASAASKMPNVVKDGRNDFHRYDYVTHDDVSALVRKYLFPEGVFMTINQDEHTVEDTTSTKGKPQRIHTLKLRVTFHDADSDKTIEMVGYGQSLDNEDKGVGKAFSSGLKGILMKTFLIPSGDPEEDIENPVHDKRRNDDSSLPVVPPMFKDFPKERQDKARAKLFAMSGKLGVDPYKAVGHLLTMDPIKKRGSLTLSTVEQVSNAINTLKGFLDAATVDQVQESPPSGLPVSESTRQSATANGVIDPTKFDPEPNEWAKMPQQAFALGLRNEVKKRDIRLHAVLADAKIDHNGRAVRFRYPDGYDWQYGKTQEGAHLIKEITGMDVIVELTQEAGVA